MLLRGRSKDRKRKVTPPGPSYMSNDQFADYLADLRNNRVARPSGARPQPASSRSETERGASTISIQTPSPTTDAERTSTELGTRSASVLSHRRAQSSLSTYSVASRTGRQLAKQPSQASFVVPLKPSEVVPTDTYMERGQRWMEKEEAVALREAMEDLDLKREEEEEARVHAAAQNEASELVYQHQNPEAANPDAPYRYNDHLKKNSYAHARTQSVGRYGGMGIATGLARDLPPRSVSGGSSSSGGLQSPRGRISSDCFNDEERALSPDGGIRRSMESSVRPSMESSRGTSGAKSSQKLYGSISAAGKFGSSRMRSVKRNISGEIGRTFTGEQIWEEPEESTPRGCSQEELDVPAPLRIKPRNPLNRVSFAEDVDVRSSSTPPEQTKKIHKTEIQHNPPTQSRNPLYTANPPPRANTLPVAPTPEIQLVLSEEVILNPVLKDGLEIRSEEIRQATSMRLKDRSPKLPTPTVVSDKPGRPIVSFDANWKPKEADTKPEVRRRSPFDRPSGQRQTIPTRSDSKNVSSPISTVLVSESFPAQVTESSTVTVPKSDLPQTTTPSVKVPETKRSVPTYNAQKSMPPVPTINVPVSRTSVPTINFPDTKRSIPTISTPTSKPSIPTINIPDPRQSIPTVNVPSSNPSVPTINFPDTPEISVSAPSIPSINVPSGTPKSNGQRPLPDPKAASSRPQPHGHPPMSRGHWSPAAGKRATATCHQCTLPIEGRVVALHGIPEHFHPECFICFNCGTGLESLEIRFEPESKRAQRLDRIRRRAQGEELPEIEGQTFAEDGDERMRFYCHLDWHETFAPKCKHCKTPIIGEHTVALGEHWHYGHFFCAECGDPFEKGQTHIEKDGYAWCLGCQTKRTERRAPKCKKCKNPVIGQYVQALGGEWHDECFRCHECNNGFDDGCFYPKEVDNEIHVMCVQCLQTQLKA